MSFNREYYEYKVPFLHEYKITSIHNTQFFWKCLYQTCSALYTIQDNPHPLDESEKHSHLMLM